MDKKINNKKKHYRTCNENSESDILTWNHAYTASSSISPIIPPGQAAMKISRFTAKKKTNGPKYGNPPCL